MISYTITVCNEHEELDKLIQTLSKHTRPGDEIVIQTDKYNTTDEVRAVLEKHSHLQNLVITEHPLNGDFAAFKNHIQNFCTQPWIFNIDADELPSEELLINVRNILSLNEEVEVFLLPRWNTVEGITDEHIAKWGWRVDDLGRINWPDWQMRIWRNVPSIHWQNKVHEVLTGFTKYTFMPEQEEFCIYHPKTIERQERQNDLYSKIDRG